MLRFAFYTLSLLAISFSLSLPTLALEPNDFHLNRCVLGLMDQSVLNDFKAKGAVLGALVEKINHFRAEIRLTNQRIEELKRSGESGSEEKINELEERVENLKVKDINNAVGPLVELAEKVHNEIFRPHLLKHHQEYQEIRLLYQAIAQRVTTYDYDNNPVLKKLDSPSKNHLIRQIEKINLQEWLKLTDFSRRKIEEIDSILKPEHLPNPQTEASAKAIADLKELRQNWFSIYVGLQGPESKFAQRALHPTFIETLIKLFKGKLEYNEPLVLENQQRLKAMRDIDKAVFQEAGLNVEILNWIYVL